MQNEFYSVEYDNGYGGLHYFKDKDRAFAFLWQKFLAIRGDASDEYIQEAFKEMNAAKKAFNTTVDEASKIYAEEMKAAKDKYVATVDQAEVAYLEAEKKYKENLKAFSDKHGNFHMTLKDGDVVTSISQQKAAVDPATEFLKSVIKMFNL